MANSPKIPQVVGFAVSITAIHINGCAVKLFGINSLFWLSYAFVVVIVTPSALCFPLLMSFNELSKIICLFGHSNKLMLQQIPSRWALDERHHS